MCCVVYVLIIIHKKNSKFFILKKYFLSNLIGTYLLYVPNLTKKFFLTFPIANGQPIIIMFY